MNDYYWQGTPEKIESVIVDQINIIGPRILDGISYVCIRTEEALTKPTGIKVTSPELGVAILGVWA